jgi:hypothetical protein
VIAPSAQEHHVGPFKPAAHTETATVIEINMLVSIGVEAARPVHSQLPLPSGPTSIS